MDTISLNTPFSGDAAKALETIASTLASNGFKIMRRSAYDLELKGPPNPQTHHEMTRFWGASTVKVSESGGALKLTAEMDQLNRSSKLALKIYAIMTALAVAAPALAIGLAGDIEASLVIAGTVLAILVPGVFVIPVLNRSYEKRIKESYDTLLHNAAIMAAG